MEITLRLLARARAAVETAIFARPTSLMPRHHTPLDRILKGQACPSTSDITVKCEVRISCRDRVIPFLAVLPVRRRDVQHRTRLPVDAQWPARMRSSLPGYASERGMSSSPSSAMTAACNSIARRTLCPRQGACPNAPSPPTRSNARSDAPAIVGRCDAPTPHAVRIISSAVGSRPSGVSLSTSCGNCSLRPASNSPRASPVRCVRNSICSGVIT